MRLFHSRNGFSLLEVAIVILVLGLLASVTAPRYADSLRQVDLQTSAHRLASHFNHARQIAVNRGRTTEVVCDNADGVYEVRDVSFPDRPSTSLRVDLDQDVDPAMRLIASFDDQATLQFDLEGRPRVAGRALELGEVQIHLGGSVLLVVIDPSTGEARVQRPTPVAEPARDWSVDGTSGATP